MELEPCIKCVEEKAEKPENGFIAVQEEGTHRMLGVCYKHFEKVKAARLVELGGTNAIG